MATLQQLKMNLKRQLLSGKKVNTMVWPFNQPDGARNLSSCVQLLENGGLKIDREESAIGSVLYYCKPASIECFHSEACRNDMIERIRMRIRDRKTDSSFNHLSKLIQMGDESILSDERLKQLYEGIGRRVQ